MTEPTRRTTVADLGKVAAAWRPQFEQMSRSLNTAMAAVAKSPMLRKPSQSTDPAAGRYERGIDGLLRAAANLAPEVMPDEIAEQTARVLWIYYNTEDAGRFEALARSIIAAADEPAKV